MIDTTLSFILEELNAFLGARIQNSEHLAVLSSLVNLDGTVPLGIENKLVLSLVNIERESAAPSLGTNTSGGGSHYAHVSPTLNLNLYLLVSASFGGNYSVGLRLLSNALAFFQAKPNFNAHNSPSFPSGLERLSLESVSLDTQVLNNLWAVLGAKYLPSMMYKLRMLTFQQGWATHPVPGVSGTDAQVGG